MKNFSKAFVLIILLASFTSQVSAQSYSVSSDGKDFFLGFMFPSYNKVGHPGVVAYYGAYALVSSYSDNNHITVSYFDRRTGQEQTYTRYVIPGRTGIQIPLDISSMLMNDTGDAPEFCACHIISERPINIEFFSTGACSGGSYIAAQTLGLGMKYVVSSYNDNPGNGGILCDFYSPSKIENSEGFFEIVAPFDGTNVTIIPNATTMGGHIGTHSGRGANQRENPYAVNLRRGQCYLVKSSSTDGSVDISGSIIQSNKPVAVLGGHENAFIGGVSGKNLEGRNFMIQEMLPVDSWDTTGYVMIPLKDSQPADPSQFQGVGENYRVYSSDSTTAKINFFDGCGTGSSDMSNSRLNYPARERDLVTCPVDMEATNGKKFSAIMYDNRNFADSAPFPAPSMITVVPISHWRTSYLWYVPANKFESLQGYYANIIAVDSDFTGTNGILASFNGGTLRPITQAFSLEQQWKNIPGHPELTGIRFKLTPGSYYAKGPHPFMVYNYGFRGLDPNNDLGDMDCEDYFFSYGSPAGMQMGNGTAHIRIAVDTFCSYWNLCVFDSTLGLKNQGIKSVTILDDPNGDFVQPPEVSYNTALVDTGGIDVTELDFSGNDTGVCFKVTVFNPIDSAYAALFIVDDNNNAGVFRLQYNPPLVNSTPDSGKYLLTSLGKDTCSSYVFYNIGKSFQTSDTIITKDSITHKSDTVINNVTHHIGNPFTFSSDKLSLNNPNFKVTGTVPSLPVTVPVGDSLVITACFTANDTVTQRDTIELVNECFTAPIALVGNGITPIILADDHDFGSVLVDSTKCAQVGVRNIGTAPLILTKQWLMDHYGINFTFPDSLLLPITLNPGQKINFEVCYTPHIEGFDSTTIHWGTNLQDPYLHQKKDYSLLIGKGVRAGFVWDRVSEILYMDSSVAGDSVIIRVRLTNNSGIGGPVVHINTVSITGPDSLEFYILNDQLGKLPLGNFDLAWADTIWVDIIFKPDLTKPYPLKFADRHANLVASGSPEKDQIVTLIGTWAKDGVAPTPKMQLFTIRPNPASGNSVIVSFASPQLAKATLSLYDILGREIYKQDVMEGVSRSEILLRNLNAGVYYVRFSSDTGTQTEKLDIIK